MSELVTVQNLSSRPKSIVHQGRQITIDALASQSYVKEVADKFLNTHVGVVTNVENTSTVYDAQLPNSETVWIANVTGDPDAPDKVIGDKYQTKAGWVIPEYPNPKREAITVTRRYDLGQKTYVAKDGAEEALNLEQIKITVPPFTRRQFPKEIASWMLMRDGMSDAAAKGRIIKSRPPSSFEPDLNWTLDEMRVYLRLCDPSKDIGPNESEVRARSNGGSDAEVDAAKRKLWPRIFMLLVDPTVRLPTRTEFNDFIRGDGAQLVSKKVK